MGDFLNKLNPLNWLQTILVWIGIFAVGLIIGGIGGCKYKQAQWDAEKIRAMAKAKKQEGEDRVAGAGTVAEYRKDQLRAQEAKDFNKGIRAGNPKLATVICPAAKTPDNVKVIEKEKNENPLIILTPNFKRMYDVSAEPGNVELRVRTYDPAQETTLDEGFTEVIEPNNFQHAACVSQLNKLIDRIEQKQRIFANP